MNIGMLLIIVSAIAWLANLFNLIPQPNRLIGYRTKRSLLNPECWNLAQKIFFPLSILIIMIVMILYKNMLFNTSMYTILCLASYILAAIITEYILYRKISK
jgi:uncharacterized membrane protein